MGPFTMGDLCSVQPILEAAQGNRTVGRLIMGNVYVGEARAIGRESGLLASGDDDVRALFLRVTLDSGIEVFWPVRELMDEVRSGEFVSPYRRG